MSIGYNEQYGRRRVQLRQLSTDHGWVYTIVGNVDRLTGLHDTADRGFGNSELGFIYPDFFVGPNSAVPGTGQIIHTRGNIGFAPVSLAAWNTYYGAYFNETFDITNWLSVTAGGRYNIAQIAMSDLFGTSPDLNAQYTFERFNPVAGFTYKILPELMTFYAGYSEANRAPTPLELGCSNPQRPCLLEASCSENFVIPPDVFGQTLSVRPKTF